MMVPETTGRSEPVHDENDEDASEAQAQVIASLRSQVTDLFSQVTQLNSKLVASYDRVSDLEDQLHDASSSLRNASVTISSLELERSHHLAALNTGLLVEKAHVTAELNRLMERATEEAAQRGQAESARHDIEKDLDDLSANLFDQANTMVAEARLNQAKSERKVQDAEQALKIAEDAVKDMQVQMQGLQAEKEAAEREAGEAKLTMGKGKWVEHDDSRVRVPRIRFMTTHTPYVEFIAFLAHLRGLRASQPTAPVVSTLLGQPFIARLLNEDSEPTVRLDLAPSLNWLSRRSVLAAIHAGMLTVEPVSFSGLVQELHQHPQSMTISSLSCALCGTLIARLPSTSSVSRTHSTNGSSWFKYPLALGSAQNHNAGIPQSAENEPPGQVYIFRLATATVSAPPPALAPTHISSVSMSAVGTSSRPPLNTISSSRVIQAQTQNSPYPLCTSNYCLTRLRSTCSLWAFVRVGIVERIWEEEIVQPPRSLGVNGNTPEALSSLTSASTGNQPTNGATVSSASEKPPIPPRRRRLWEMASALGERAVSWGKEGGENTKEKDSAKKLPPPPPSHPSAPHPHAESLTSQVDSQEPPPLPMRSIVRGTSATGVVVPTSGTENGVVASESTDPAASPNGHIDADKTEPSTSDSSSTSVGEITFAAPPPESSPLPTTTSHPIAAAEPSAPLIQDHIPPSSPHTVPLPMTPTTPVPTAQPTSPVLRPRSRLSSPASPPPSSRPGSPSISRSRTGSPAPAGIVRTMSPSSGHPSSGTPSHMRGKTSVSSPLAPSSRPASPAPATGPGAPPLPRRAAARRAVPAPPMSGGLKATGEGGKQEVVSSSVTTPTDPIPEPSPLTSETPKATGEGAKEEVVSSVAADPTPETDSRRTSEAEIVAETKSSGDTEREGKVSIVKDEVVSQVTSAPAPLTEAVPGPAKDVTVGDTKTARGDAQAAVNGTSATVISGPHLPPTSNGDCDASVDTASTKQSSNTEEEGFASDATWEERTWKELVRLKEEMFWARIGGLRALQG